jgi:hypothetical protein
MRPFEGRPLVARHGDDTFLVRSRLLEAVSPTHIILLAKKGARMHDLNA